MAVNSKGASLLVVENTTFNIGHLTALADNLADNLADSSHPEHGEWS
jgi:hypothetical protein